MQDRLMVEVAINMLDEIVECYTKGYRYPFCLERTKEISDYLVSLLEEGD